MESTGSSSGHFIANHPTVGVGSTSASEAGTTTQELTPATQPASTYRLDKNQIHQSQITALLPNNPTPRIPFNDGYGDFCFGRLINEKHDYSNVDPELKPHNVQFVEMDDFEGYDLISTLGIQVNILP
jgi:hypothetical protein